MEAVVPLKPIEKKQELLRRLTLKMGKLADKQLKQFSKSKDPFAGFEKSVSKFAKKADKLTQRYNKKK
mgnify:CR=1 FL=1